MALRNFSFLYGPKRKYDYIIPIGDNCKYSTTFHHFYKFVDSTLLNWAELIEKENLEEIIRNPEKIYSEGFEYEEERNMWICKKYMISFHGRSLPEEIHDKNGNIDEIKKQADFEELQSRLKYLIDKTKKMIASDKKKLFVFTYEENDYDENLDFLKNIYSLLNEISTNFDFLIVVHSNTKFACLESLQKEFDNIFVKTITYKKHNLDWAKLNCEFVPKFKKKQTTKRKFELIN